MKKIFAALTVILMASPMIVLSQDEVVPKDTVWKTGGIISINLTQAYYENWTAGGVPSVAGTSFLKYFATYEKKRWRWNSTVDLAYGLINEREKKMRKTDDKIQLETKLGYSMGHSWFFTVLGTFKTQFTEGYEDPEVQEIKISDFMSPAYVNTSLGFDFLPNENFSLFIAPVAMKATIVQDNDLANAGAFGVEAGKWETIKRDSTTTDSVFINGKNIRYEMGAHLKMMYKRQLMTNVNLQTKLELYANYFDNLGNVDVNWETLIEMKVNKSLSANFRFEIIYDDDVKIPTGTDSEGNQSFGPRMQIKQLFGLGLAYKF